MLEDPPLPDLTNFCGSLLPAGIEGIMESHSIFLSDEIRLVVIPSQKLRRESLGDTVKYEKETDRKRQASWWKLLYSRKENMNE
jgi:hypothetical protein